jgi:hypothetical protein
MLSPWTVQPRMLLNTFRSGLQSSIGSDMFKIEIGSELCYRRLLHGHWRIEWVLVDSDVVYT